MTPGAPPLVVIRDLKRSDADEARELILAGLEEHYGWRDATLNRDLDDIVVSYADATFLVAADGLRIVGTGALVPRPGAEAEIVRMSVDTAFRRTGIGSAILHELIERAKARGVRRVFLETTVTWEDVQAFYQAQGFRLTHRDDDGAYFELVIATLDSS